jgi:hypothetical protein
MSVKGRGVGEQSLFLSPAALLFPGALLWLKIDASEELSAEIQVARASAGV